jgi:hypothetical protein
VTTDIPLRTYRLTPRKPVLAIHDGGLLLRLPGFFGRHWFRIALTAVCAVDLAKIEEPETIGWFDPPPVIPFLPTTSPYVDPTLGLLFRDRQRVPPLRALAALAPNVDLPFTWFQTRSAKGALFDGLLLRAVDAAVATEALRTAGADTTTRPDRWLAAFRSVVTDGDDEALRTHSRLKRASRMTLASRAAMAVAIPGLFGGRFLLERSDNWTGYVAVAIGIGSMGTSSILRRRARSIEQARS